MKSKAALLGVVSLLCATMAFGQGQGRGQGGGGGRGQQGGEGGGRGQQTAAPPAMDKVTPEIPGVVKAGTKLEIVKFGLGGTDSGTGMPDGSVLVSSGGKILKMDPNRQYHYARRRFAASSRFND